MCYSNFKKSQNVISMIILKKKSRQQEWIFPNLNHCLLKCYGLELQHTHTGASHMTDEPVRRDYRNNHVKLSVCKTNELVVDYTASACTSPAKKPRIWKRGRLARGVQAGQHGRSWQRAEFQGVTYLTRCEIRPQSPPLLLSYGVK